MPRLCLAPNITGEAFWARGAAGGTGGSSGAFELILDGLSQTGVNTSGSGDVRLSLDVSKVSSIYSGTTVQPPSCQTLMIIKV